MKEEEIKKLLADYLNEFLNNSLRQYIYNILASIHGEVEKLRDDNKKEHEDLLMRAVNAETKLKLYESPFSKLNLNMEVKNNDAKLL